MRLKDRVQDTFPLPTIPSSTILQLLAETGTLYHFHFHLFVTRSQRRYSQLFWGNHQFSYYQ